MINKKNNLSKIFHLNLLVNTNLNKYIYKNNIGVF